MTTSLLEQLIDALRVLHVFLHLLRLLHQLGNVSTHVVGPVVVVRKYGESGVAERPDRLRQHLRAVHLH